MLKTENRQKLFDIAYNGVIAQGEAAWNQSRGTCMYLTQSDSGKELKCGVGHLLDANALDFAKKFECAIDEMVDDYRFESDVAVNIDDDFLNFLVEIQSAHDGAQYHAHTADNSYSKANFIELFEQKMVEVAKKFNLEYKN